jgi:hypothetical protein
MLAAVLLQVGAVPLPTAAVVSIIRFDNKGPWSLLGKMIGRWSRGSVSIGLLAALLSFTTLSLQFTSTALLSQVGIASVPVAISAPQTYYGINPNGPTFDSQIGASRQFLHTTPKGYPAFAEWISNATVSDANAQHGEFAPNHAPGITDTGTVVRAFLPINDTDERSRLTEYHGFGTAVDMRVACMRPKLSNVVLSTQNGYRVGGQAEIEQNPLGLVRKADPFGHGNSSHVFDCGFGAAYTKNYSESFGWPLSLCTPNGGSIDEGT